MSASRFFECLKKHLLLTVLAVVVIVGTAWFFDPMRVTNGERQVGIEAVYSVDMLRTDGVSDDQYMKFEQRASRLIAEAHIRSKTARDKTIANDLDIYLAATDPLRRLERIQISDIENGDTSDLNTTNDMATKRLKVSQDTRQKLMKDLE